MDHRSSTPSQAALSTAANTNRKQNPVAAKTTVLNAAQWPHAEGSPFTVAAPRQNCTDFPLSCLAAGAPVHYLVDKIIPQTVIPVHEFFNRLTNLLLTTSPAASQQKDNHSGSDQANSPSRR